AVLRNPFFGFGRGAVVNRDLVAALRLEMPRHWVTHDSEPDECDLCHVSSPEKSLPHSVTLRWPQSSPRRGRPGHPSRLAELVMGPATLGRTRRLAPQDDRSTLLMARPVAARQRGWTLSAPGLCRDRQFGVAA